MDNFSHFDLLAVANGYILRVGYSPAMGGTIAKDNEFVFETFESLVRFLETYLEKPVAFAGISGASTTKRTGSWGE